MLELGIWNFKTVSDETIHQGLDGVVVDTTRISKVMPEINSLVYSGYPVQELAEACSFEEVAWLIWHGELPNASELKSFQADERARRNISPAMLDRDSQMFAHRASDGCVANGGQFSGRGGPRAGKNGRRRESQSRSWTCWRKFRR